MLKRRLTGVLQKQTFVSKKNIKSAFSKNPKIILSFSVKVWEMCEMF